MRCTSWIWAPLGVALIAGCSGEKRYNDTGTAGTGTESGTMRNGAATTDTALPGGDTSAATRGMSSDTAHRAAGTSAESVKANQTKSGVTNTKTGKSTLGKGVTRTRPDQGQPVTSKGDTLSAGPDTTAGNQ